MGHVTVDSICSMYVFLIVYKWQASEKWPQNYANNKYDPWSKIERVSFKIFLELLV